MKKLIILIPYLMIMLLPESVADPRAQVVKSFCGPQLEHNTTIFVQNFFTNMENIRAAMRTSGFGAGSVGSGPDTDYGLGQCYGDLSLIDCVSCHAGARVVVARCYPANGATVYLDGCFMRSENYSFFQEYSGPNDQSVCANTTRRGSAFRSSVIRALSRAISAAPNRNGYARAQVATGNDSAYVLANCWKTINASACRACLQNAYASVSGCFPSSEGRAIHTGCFLRYSDTDFLNRVVPQNGNTRDTVITIVAAFVGASFILIIGVVIGVKIWKSMTIQKKKRGEVEKLMKILRDKNLNFKYSTLEKATDSFDEANKIGQGGFGTVYKGFLPDGRVVAVKRLFFNNKHRITDMLNEVNIISSIEHKNLVRLLGCSCLGPETLFVYEFLPNKSLDRFIFDSRKSKELNWEKRFEIIIGTTEGLVYLHENTRTRIIHRDIKAGNILLDSNLRPKIADFGLARSFQEDQSHISTAVAGTLGYMAPEYIINGQLTEKTDVYSFGVLLLEIVTGRPNNGSQTSDYTDSLISTVWKHFQERTVEEIFGSNLIQHNYHNLKSEVLRVVHVGLLCTQKNAAFRPSMSKALLMLLAKERLPPPTHPAFMDETMTHDDMIEDESSILDHGNATSVAVLSHSIFFPR